MHGVTVPHVPNPFAGGFFADLLRIDRELLDNTAHLRNLLIAALKIDGFDVRKDVDEEYTPEGYTLVVILGESHSILQVPSVAVLATYFPKSDPKKGVAHFSLESCRSETDGPRVLDMLAEGLRPERIKQHCPLRRIVDPDYVEELDLPERTRQVFP